MKGQVLKLNKHFFPVGICSPREAIKNIFSNAAFPLDIQYAEDQTGEFLEQYEWFEPIKKWSDWAKLPVRPYDDFIGTTRGKIRMPSVIICAEYSRIKWNKVLFPTKTNIWNRDGWTCCYTGQKLTKDNISVDHIVPVSRGGENTWTNLVTAEREVNRKKADKSLEESGLKLLRKPTTPKGGMVFPILKPEWTKFIAESAA